MMMAVRSGTVASLVTVTVCAGPHETVLVEVAAYPYTITGEEKHRHIANQPGRAGGVAC